MTHYPNNYRLEDLSERCRFCSHPDFERIFFCEEQYYHMLTLGPIVEGYSLIIPYIHISCYGKLPKNHYKGLIREKKLISDLHRAAYGSSSTLFFEHGNVGSSISKLPSDNHAHLHAVPMVANDKSLVDLLIEDINLIPEKYYNFQDFYDQYKNLKDDIHYLYIEENGLSYVFFVNDIVLPSQYLRRMLAKLLDIDPHAADWLQQPNWDVILRSIKVLNESLPSLVSQHPEKKFLCSLRLILQEMDIISPDVYINEHTRLIEDLDMDSIDILQLIVKLEERLKITVQDEDVVTLGFDCVKDIIDMVLPSSSKSKQMGCSE